MHRRPWGVYCNGERMGRTAEQAMQDQHLKVNDVGLDINCSGVAPSATAKPEEAIIEVTYTGSNSSDCSCLHAAKYRINNVPVGEWRVRAWSHEAQVRVNSRDTGG